MLTYSLISSGVAENRAGVAAEIRNKVIPCVFSCTPAEARKWLAVRSQDNGRPGQGNICRGVRVPSSGRVLQLPCRALGVDALNSTIEADHSLLPPNFPTDLVKHDPREAVCARLGGIVFVRNTDVPIDAVLLSNLLYASPGVPLDGIVDPLPVPNTVDY